MDDTTSKTSGPNRLFTFFGNPWVGIVGSVASILSLLLAVYFYYQGVSVRELVYYVNPARAIVVKQGTASRLAVSYDGRPLAQDVTAAQVAIWNSGRQAIRREAILQPVVIKTEPRVPILEATVRRKSREVVALDVDQAQLAEGQVSVSWNILEQGDGGVVQIVYAAGPDTQIQCVGVIEGQRGIRELRYLGAIRSPAEQIRQNSREAGAVTALLGLVIAMNVVMVVVSRRRGWVVEFRKAMIFWGGPLVVALVLLAYLFYSVRVPEPPFGF
jgi:hypothetical protein